MNKIYHQRGNIPPYWFRFPLNRESKDDVLNLLNINKQSHYICDGAKYIWSKFQTY